MYDYISVIFCMYANNDCISHTMSVISVTDYIYADNI
jgi:hypothetical protein